MTIRAYQNHQPQIHPSAYIDPAAVVIGKVSIGADTSIWPMVAVRGDVHTITIGERTNVQDGSVLHVTADNQFTPGGLALIIGDDVTVGHGAILHACTVENLCLIGMGVTVLDGAIVRERTMVAAGSLVPPGTDLETGFLWKGSPVQKARTLKPTELEYLQYSSGHYVKLKNQHMATVQTELK